MIGAEINSKSLQNIEENEDYAVIRSILTGDINQFKILQKKYIRIINNLIKKMIRDDDDVDDLTQETFIKAYNALPNFQFGYTFSSWIFRIASNTCIDFIRKKKFNFVYIDENFENDEEPVFEIKDTSYQPDIAYQINERSEILKIAIERLPDNYKQIIKLRHEDELEYQEIANKLNLPLGTVKVHLFRARKQLLESLKGKEFFANT